MVGTYDDILSRREGIMIPYYRETISCFSYRTKCRIGDVFYSYFPVSPMRLLFCTISRIEITENDIKYFYDTSSVDDMDYKGSGRQSVSEGTFDLMLFRTEEEALKALKLYMEEEPMAKYKKFEIDDKTGHWREVS